MKPRPSLALILVVALVAIFGCRRPQSPTVLAYGDSHTSTGGWFGAAPVQWTIHNRGQFGNRCSQVVARLDFENVDAEALVVFCGTNDVRHPSYDMAETLSEIDSGIQWGLARTMAVILVTVPPQLAEGSTEANQKIYALNAEIEALAALYAIGMADVWSEFLLQPDVASLFVDGIHFSEAGDEIAGKAIVAAILGAL